jgi:hypothetical protein
MADIVRAHHRDLLARWSHVLSREQRKALRDIRDCRSAALGGRVQQCDRCGPGADGVAPNRLAIRPIGIHDPDQMYFARP